MNGRDGILMQKAAAYILSKQSRTTDNEQFSTVGLGEGLTMPQHKRTPCYEMLYRASGDLL